MQAHYPLRRAALLILAPLALAASTALPVAQGQVPDDPALDQTIDRDQAVVTGPAVLDDGHVDIGPRFSDGAFTLLVHDDAVIPSVWRSLDETVLRVGDDARQTVPDDPTYAFLGAEPGTDVYVIPQVQRAGVVWVGWNTQDPEVMERLDRGASLTMVGAEGPGRLTMYLQSGALGDPEVLWTSTDSAPQPIWVELNTHTHANWVFTEPGVYLVGVEVSGELITGEVVSDVRVLRFAVGDTTSIEGARSAEPSAALVTPADRGSADAGEPGPEEPGSDGGGGSGVLVVGLVAALVLALAVVLVLLRGSAAKRRAEAERAAAGSAAPE